MIHAALFFLALRQEKPPFFDDIQAFVKQDQAKPPAKGQILFVGSSSFTRWTTVQADFPNFEILNRGFGGSSIPDVIRYADQIIFPYQPKQIVIYCGENDFAADPMLPAYKVFDRFKDLFSLIRKRLPAVPIVYVSMKPSPSREAFLPKMLVSNGWIRDYLKDQKNTTFVDVFPLMLDAGGKPRKELFGPDMLHMNPKGYEIWIRQLEPVLAR